MKFTDKDIAILTQSFGGPEARRIAAALAKLNGDTTPRKSSTDSARESIRNQFGDLALQHIDASKSAGVETAYKSLSSQKARQQAAERITQKALRKDKFWASVGLTVTEKALSTTEIEKLLTLIERAALGTALSEQTVTNLLKNEGYQKTEYIITAILNAKGS